MTLALAELPTAKLGSDAASSPQISGRQYSSGTRGIYVAWKLSPAYRPPQLKSLTQEPIVLSNELRLTENKLTINDIRRSVEPTYSLPPRGKTLSEEIDDLYAEWFDLARRDQCDGERDEPTKERIKFLRDRLDDLERREAAQFEDYLRSKLKLPITTGSSDALERARAMLRQYESPPSANRTPERPDSP